MKKVMDYINSSLSSVPESEHLEKFKKSLIEEVTIRTNQITHAGLRNVEIIDDIIISEHPDIIGEYNEEIKKYNKKRKRKTIFLTHVISAVVYVVALLCTYLTISFTTHRWSRTWPIIADAFIMLIAFILLRYAIHFSKSKSRIIVQFPRLISPLIIFLTAASVFNALIAFHVYRSWLAFIFGVLIMFIVDSIYSEIKAERFAIIFHLLYIVPSFAMIYVILGALSVIPWHPGWIMIPASVIIILVILIVRLIIHSRNKEEMEVEDSWNEN